MERKNSASTSNLEAWFPTNLIAPAVDRDFIAILTVCSYSEPGGISITHTHNDCLMLLCRGHHCTGWWLKTCTEVAKTHTEYSVHHTATLGCVHRVLSQSHGYTGVCAQRHEAEIWHNFCTGESTCLLLHSMTLCFDPGHSSLHRSSHPENKMCKRQNYGHPQVHTRSLLC